MGPDELTDRMLDLTLPYPAWTHEGHLSAGYTLVSRLGEAGALTRLRMAIPRYNEAVGTPNTDTEGYHDTLTVFYVWAIARLVERGLTLEQVLVEPSVSRTAALQYWSRELLFSTRARQSWIEPVLQPGPRLPEGCAAPGPLAVPAGPA